MRNSDHVHVHVHGHLHAFDHVHVRVRAQIHVHVKKYWENWYIEKEFLVEANKNK
jgi:hypothetical protein